MLGYLAWIKPFENQKGNFINIYNECVLISVFGVTLLMNTVEVSQSTSTAIGWISIFAIAVSLVLTWTFTLPEAWREFRENVSSCCRRKRAEDDTKENGATKRRNRSDDRDLTRARERMQTASRMVRSSTSRFYVRVEGRGSIGEEKELHNGSLTPG